MLASGKKKRKNNEGEMSFLQHLEELRWHIIRSIAAIVIFMVIAFLFKNLIFDTIILAPKDPDFFTNRLLCKLGQIVNIDALCINTKPVNLISIKMSGQITTHIVVALVAGVILAFPYVLWEFWKFFKPLFIKTNKSTPGELYQLLHFFSLSVYFSAILHLPRFQFIS